MDMTYWLERIERGIKELGSDVLQCAAVLAITYARLKCPVCWFSRRQHCGTMTPPSGGAGKRPVP